LEIFKILCGWAEGVVGIFLFCFRKN